MPKCTAFILGILTTTFCNILNTYGAQIVDIDVNNIIKHLKQPHTDGYYLVNQRYKKPLYDYQTKERDRLNDNEFLKFIEQAVRGIKSDNTHYEKYKDKLFNKGYESKKSNSEPYVHSLSVKPAWLKSGEKTKSSTQDTQVDSNHPGSLRSGDLSDYSKIYFVIDPRASLTKSDVRDISKMVSTVLRKANNNKKALEEDPGNFYKGFAVRDQRRRIREPFDRKEMKDSVEFEYKPKRGRGDYGGGGGGRTAIPYIRHRGDIYERD